MISRKPKIDVAEAPLIWLRIPEMAQYWNGASFTAPHIEPHLNTLMRIVQQRLKDKNPKLCDEIDLFVSQETNHYKMHTQFNKRMYDAGYGCLKPIERQFRDDLKQMMTRRSLAFNVAYCAGFENFSMFSAKYLFEAAGDLFEGADRRGADLFLWHLAEEFEHRTVCHDAFAAISGNYFIRVAGLIYSALHFGGFTKKLAAKVLETYRQDMSSEEKKASIAREKAAIRRMNRYIAPRLLAVFLPFYNPGKYEPVPAIRQALDHYASISA